MYSPSTEEIKKLRQTTLAPMLQCKEALIVSKGDFKKAVIWLNQEGAIKAAGKSEKSVGAGIIDSYIHNGNQVGVLLDIRCETDFVARNEEFKKLAHGLCLQIAAMSPDWISPKDIPSEVIKGKRQIWSAELRSSEKSKEIIEKIIEGKLLNFYRETCLLSQPYIRNEEETVEEQIVKTIARLGENIKVEKFVRFEI
jgi:elongation factor Ts